MTTQILTRAQAAKRLGISPYTLADWARARKIGSVKVGREIRFTEDHIADYLAAHDRPRTPIPTTGQTSRSRALNR